MNRPVRFAIGFLSLVLVFVTFQNCGRDLTNVGSINSSSASIRASSSGAPPILFFTDIISGPNSGGENVSGFSGAYVTLYGNHFGSSQSTSTVTLNGQNCLRVVSWGAPWLWYQKIVVQLGSSCTSGDFSITVNGQASLNRSATLNNSQINPATFTVAPGHIYCVSPSGNDSGTGSFSAGCWKTPQNALDNMAPGDITYVEAGKYGDGCTEYNAALCITSSGKPGSPKALVAYPAATAVIATNQDGIRTPWISGPGPYWVIAGLTISTTAPGGEAISFNEANMREVANTLSCPNGIGTAACAELESDNTNNGHFVYGNEWLQAGTPGQSEKTYHALYFSAGDNHIDVGWNSIHNVGACRGIQFYEEGKDKTDLHIHDNLIHDTDCDAINLNGVDPNAGPIEVFNNVMYNVGTGPDNSDGAAVYSCVNAESNGSYTSPIQIYNNTCYNAGDPTTVNPSQSGAFSLYVPAVLQNNVVYQNNGQPYLTSDSGCSSIKAGSSHNDWYGQGAAPNCANLANNLNVNPAFANLSGFDFHLASGSPLIDAGIGMASLMADFDGIPRPQGVGYDIGAYEYASGSVIAPTPTPAPTANPTPNPSPQPSPTPSPTPVDQQPPTTSIISPTDGAIVPMQTSLLIKANASSQVRMRKLSSLWMEF